MGESLLAYIQRLELIAFFAGYPLVYSMVHFITNLRSGNASRRLGKPVALMPYAYALTATLFLGLVFREMTTNHQENSDLSSFPIHYLRLWGILATVFWIPALSRRPVYSLLHSMVFFVLWLLDIIKGMIAANGKEIVGNDMKIYTDSLILNSICFGLVLAFNYFQRRIVQKRKINTER